MFLIAGDPEINPQFVDIASTAVVLLHKKDNRWDEKMKKQITNVLSPNPLSASWHAT